MRDWKHYIKKNKTSGDCQLVTAVNAYHFLTGRRIQERRYQRLVDVTGCRHDSAIGIGKVWKELGIAEGVRMRSLPFSWRKGDKTPLSLGSLESWQEALPLEISVWHKFFGFHSVLAVDIEPRVRAVRITNFSRVTSSNGWIFKEDLMHFTEQNPDKGEPRYQCRSFKLAE